MVFLNQGTTITGGVVTFEASDTTAFTNAYSVNCVQANSSLFGSTYTLAQSTNQALDCDVSGAAAFQMRLSTVITGSGTVNAGIMTSAMPTVPEVAVGGTVTANAGTGQFNVTCTAANCPTNMAQVAGTNADTNSGTKSAGTLRVVLATDQPALTNKLLVTPDSVALPANQSVNVAQVNGAATATAASGVQKVGVTGNAGAAVDAAGQNVASPANELLVGAQFNTSPTTITTGNMSPLQADSAANLKVNISAQTLANLSDNINQVGGASVATAASGVQKVGATGSTGAAFDTPTVTASTAPTQSINVACTNQAVALSAGQSAGVSCDSVGRLNVVTVPSSSSSQSMATPFVSTSLTTATVVKASAGNLFGWVGVNGSTTTICYLQFMNTASSPTLGTNAVFSIPIGVSTATVPGSHTMIAAIAVANFATGISVGLSTTYNGSTACGTAGNATVFFK
jgi:hypothetical protein